MTIQFFRIENVDWKFEVKLRLKKDPYWRKHFTVWLESPYFTGFWLIIWFK